MADYKAEVTLNEQDSLQDMLNLEKTMVKIYALAMTEGASKGFRNLVKSNLVDTISDQFDVFLQMTNKDYYRVESAPEKTLKEEKEKFIEVQAQLF